MITEKELFENPIFRERGLRIANLKAENERLAAALLPFANAYIKAMPNKYPQGWLTTIGNWLELEHFEAAVECFPDLPSSPYSVGKGK